MSTVKPMTANKIRSLKGVRPIVCITGYDEPFARLADSAGVDIVLVGDSLGMVSLGMPDTLGVTLEAIIHHTKAARKGISNSLLVSDLPFGSYGGSIQETINHAVALMHAGASAVKLEGRFPEEVAKLSKIGIPVIGHLGFTPQSVHVMGAGKVQGRKEAEGKMLIETAKELEEAGAFAIVLELIPMSLAKIVSEALTIPTIGIGAGPFCDGQIQVIHDILGLSQGNFVHSRKYLNLNEAVKEALENYSLDVKNHKFPTDENGFQ